MRVVAGQLRGKSIKGPSESNLTIRPTSDRAKEALFSFLGVYPKASFLDLCSGTGNVALEAYSRGYKKVIALDRDPEAIKLIKSNCDSYPIEIVCHDVIKASDLHLGLFDIIFCDPPYDRTEEFWQTLRFVIPNLLEKSGLFILETDHIFQPEPSQGLEIFKTKNYSRNHFHIFTRSV